MVDKLADGYKCEHCGTIISNHRRALGHEGTCAESKLSTHLGDEVGRIVDLDIEGFDTTPSKQLKIGESFVGRCGNCHEPVTTNNRFKKESSLFECPSCENVISS